MEFSEVNLTKGEIEERERKGARKRVEITKELDDLFKQMENESDPDARNNLRGQIDQVLKRGRRIFEKLGKSGKDELQEYYERLRKLQNISS